MRLVGWFFIMALAGCQGSSPVPEKGYAKPLRGELNCDSCRVQYFDGNALREALIEKGEYVIPAAAHPFALFVTGARQVPFSALVSDRQAPGVRLEKITDRRKGYLAGVVVRSQSGGKQVAARALEPVVDAEVVVTMGRARQAVRTDEQGRFVLALAPNRYRVLVGEQRWEVDVPAGDTMVLPVVVGRTLID